MARRGVAGRIAFVAAALVASACGTDVPDARPLVQQSATVRSVDCPSGVPSGTACGTLDVPFDHDEPDGPATTISLAVVGGTADESVAGPPVAVLQGGPGGASTDLARFLPAQPFVQVFVDQRGTGWGGPDLDCPEFEAAIPAMLSLPESEAERAVADALAACAARLADEPLLDHIDTVTHAHDVAAVMAALGFERWMAYGVSYGSTIGLELLRTGPAGMVGAVLDGVYPAGFDTDAGVVESAAIAIEAVSASCAADPSCRAFTSDFAALADDLVVRLDAEPMDVPLDAAVSGLGEAVDVRLDGVRLAELTFQLLYSERFVARLPAALAAIAGGDAAAAAWLAGTAARSLAGAYGANDEATYFAVQCHDRLPFTRGEATVGATDAGSTAFSSAVAPTPLADTCPIWEPQDAAPADAATPVRSDLPVLLLSGGFDPITPAMYAERVAETLSQATVVTQAGRGHGIWVGDDCIGSIVAAFVAAPGSAIDPSCADAGVPVAWAEP